MARGGKRKGAPGTTYSNRTDLNQPAPAVNFDGGYGDDTAMAAVQANRAAPAAVAPIPTTAPPPMRAVTPLDAPDDRPDEPVTSGLPLGPGPGPEAIGLDPDTSVLAELRAIYARYPHPDILDLIYFEEDRR